MLIQKKKIILFVLYYFCASYNSSAQTIPDSIKTKIDKLFTRWNHPNTPGCAIGIIRNDSLIYAKGYGMANLEYAIPNSPESIFHMASISKQFTAYSIVLLARQGKLNLDDDIHRYLKWFPDLKEKITIRNLLNHTSGIRDQWQLLATSGTRLDDVITQDQIIKILSQQRALNFKPGEKYAYSNSGFTMLAEIVRSVTGQSLRKFTDSAIFKPLGMLNTHVHDDYTEIVKNRTYSYRAIDSNHYANSILSYSNAGATSLFTNIDDMSKWVSHFYNADIDHENITILTQKGKLNSGKELTYALGIVVDTYKGWRQYSHGGADAGYRTNISVFPDLKMGFIVFSNLANFNPGLKSSQLADIFIKDTSSKRPVKVKRDTAMAILKETESLMKFIGSYVGEDGTQIDFDLKKNLLYAVSDDTDLLVKENINTFSIINMPETKIVFNEKPGDIRIDVMSPNSEYHLKKYTKETSPADSILKKYVGSYHCPELDCKYNIVLKDHSLWLTNIKYNDAKLTLVGRDHLMNDNWWMNHLQVLRNSKGKITGFEVNSNRVMHLQFDKIE